MIKPKDWPYHILMIVAVNGREQYTFVSHFCTQEWVLSEMARRVGHLTGITGCTHLSEDSYEQLEPTYRQNDRILEM